MNKLETLTARSESLRLEYVVQEQLYINSYYYDHTKSMIALEQMKKLKTSLGAIRAEIAGLYVAPKL
tara:strand:- start:313 stop:513 length:201 start_codon:yes stop_codon:yes gene_type:complete